MSRNELYEKEKISKLFLKLAIPGAISMLASAFYQFIEGIIVNRELGGEAFSALNLVYPFVIVIFCVSDMIGVGSSVIMAIELGKKDDKKASEVFTLSVITILISTLILGIIVNFLAPYIISLMDATSGVKEIATKYIRVYSLFSVFGTYIYAVDNYLRIVGRIKYALFLNIGLSIAIMGCEYLTLAKILPELYGSAIACLLCFMIASLIGFIPFFRGKERIKFVKFKFDVRIVFNIFRNGFSTFLSNIAGRITSIVFNYFLLKISGDGGVSVYGLLMYVDSFVFALLYGMCDSLQPAIGYNYGAKKSERVLKLTKLSFASGAFICVSSFIVMLVCPEGISRLFLDSSGEEVVAMGTVALIYFAFAYLTRWVSYATINFFQAIDKPRKAMIITFSTTFIFPLALLFIFMNLGMEGFYLNYPITYGLAMIEAIIILVLFYKKEFKNTFKINEIEKNS